MQCISLLLGTLKGEAISDQHVTLGLWLLVRYFLRGQVISWDIAPGTAHHSSQGKLSELASSARNSLSPKLLICQLPDVSHDRRSGGFDLYYLCTYHTRTYCLTPYKYYISNIDFHYQHRTYICTFPSLRRHDIISYVQQKSKISITNLSYTCSSFSLLSKLSSRTESRLQSYQLVDKIVVWSTI